VCDLEITARYVQSPLAIPSVLEEPGHLVEPTPSASCPSHLFEPTPLSFIMPVMATINQPGRAALGILFRSQAAYSYLVVFHGVERLLAYLLSVG
jgi:hypothetical protein